MTSFKKKEHKGRCNSNELEKLAQAIVKLVKCSTEEEISDD